MNYKIWAILILALFLPACIPLSPGSTSGVGASATVVPVIATPLPPGVTPPTPGPVPTLTLIPTLAGGLGPTELKYRVLGQFPNLFFCDPDYYPIAREDETDLARKRFPELQANPEEFNAILARNHLTGQDTFSDEQKLLIYREHKRLAAIPLTLTGSGYEFQIQVSQNKGSGELIKGSIDPQGKIAIQERQPSIATCPICLAEGTRIDTPGGPVPVQDLRVGNLVWSVDHAGARVAVPVLRVSRTIAPANHQVVHLVMADGRELWASPGHPTIDGRSIGQLLPGDRLDGAPVQSAGRVPYAGPATYDLLPGSATGFYWANGILIASTLN